jgi:hypothetical protein
MGRRRPTADRRMIHIRVYETTHKRLRQRAAEEDVTLQILVEDWIEKELGPARKK